MVTIGEQNLPGEQFLKHKTLILGDVNSGKTHCTLTIVESLARHGLGADIVLLDLAPETTGGIGGKMLLRQAEILLLTCTIIPPRLTGRDSAHMQQLAEQNAGAIERLFDQAISSQRSILVVNDASIYLQAGSLDRFLDLIETFSTAIINAYYGDSFVEAPFTQTERSGVEALIRHCDRSIRM